MRDDIAEDMADTLKAILKSLDSIDKSLNLVAAGDLD